MKGYCISVKDRNFDEVVTCIDSLGPDGIILLPTAFNSEESIMYLKEPPEAGEEPQEKFQVLDNITKPTPYYFPGRPTWDREFLSVSQYKNAGKIVAPCPALRQSVISQSRHVPQLFNKWYNYNHIISITFRALKLYDYCYDNDKLLEQLKDKNWSSTANIIGSWYGSGKWNKIRSCFKYKSFFIY